MRNFKFLFLFIFFAALAALSLFIAKKSFRIYQYSNIDCRASVTFTKDSEKLEMFVSQKFSDEKGLISISGTLYRNNEKFFLSQTVGFNYEQHNDTFHLKSKNISISPQMTMSNEIKKLWLPPFFLVEGKDLILKVQSLSAGKWLFTSETIPLFLCESY